MEFGKFKLGWKLLTCDGHGSEAYIDYCCYTNCPDCELYLAKEAFGRVVLRSVIDGGVYLIIV